MIRSTPSGLLDMGPSRARPDLRMADDPAKRPYSLGTPLEALPSARERERRRARERRRRAKANRNT